MEPWSIEHQATFQLICRCPSIEHLLLNRAHWPTEENRQKLTVSCIFSVHGKIGPRWPQMRPGFFLFLLIQTLPTFWATRVLILRIFIFCAFLDPTFPDFQVPDFQISRNLARARLGPWPGPGGPMSCHARPRHPMAAPNSFASCHVIHPFASCRARDAIKVFELPGFWYQFGAKPRSSWVPDLGTRYRS